MVIRGYVIWLHILKGMRVIITDWRKVLVVLDASWQHNEPTARAQSDDILTALWMRRSQSSFVCLVASFVP
jgi:hypothetical protein